MSEQNSNPGPDVSPSDAITDDDLATTPDSDEGDSTSIMDMLLSTEPEGHPQTPPDHLITGVKKALNGAMDANLRSGTTALENFAWAGIGFMYSDGSGGSQTPESGGQSGPDESEDGGLMNPEDLG